MVSTVVAGGGKDNWMAFFCDPASDLSTPSSQISVLCTCFYLTNCSSIRSCTTLPKSRASFGRSLKIKTLANCTKKTKVAFGRYKIPFFYPCKTYRNINAATLAWVSLVRAVIHSPGDYYKVLFLTVYYIAVSLYPLGATSSFSEATSLLSLSLSL